MYVNQVLLKRCLMVCGETASNVVVTFICFYVSQAKPLCFSLCSQMFDDVE